MSTKLLPAAILAGGLAKRLHPLSETIPKALVEIDGEPFIAHQLRLLRARGIDRVVLCIGYRGEMIRDVVSEGARFGLSVTYSADGPTLLGTAGALRQALPLLGEAFFVLYGDSYLECDYREVQDAFDASGKAGLMTVFRNAGAWDRSNVEFANQSIIAYDKCVQTERMQHIDYGLGVLTHAALAAVPVGEPHDLATLYHDLLRRDMLAGWEVSQRFYEVGSFAGIEELRRRLALSPRTTGGI